MNIFAHEKKVRFIPLAEAGHPALACLQMSLTLHESELDLARAKRLWTQEFRGDVDKAITAVAASLGHALHRLNVDLRQLSQIDIGSIVQHAHGYGVVTAKRRNKIVLLDPRLAEIEISTSTDNKSQPKTIWRLVPSGPVKSESKAQRLPIRALTSGITGLTRTALKILSLSAALQLLALLSPLFFQLALDEVIVSRDTDFLVLLVLAFSVIGLVSALALHARSTLLTQVDGSLKFHLSSSFFLHLMRLPLEYHGSRNIGETLSRFNSLSVVQAALTGKYIEIILDGIMSVLTISVMLFYSPKLTAVCVGSMGAFFLAKCYFTPRLRAANKELIRSASLETTFLIESVRAVRLIKFANGIESRLNAWSVRRLGLIRNSEELARSGGAFATLKQLLSASEYLIVTSIGILDVVSGAISVGMLVAFQFYRLQFTGKVASLIDGYFEREMHEIHLERLADIYNQPVEKGSYLTGDRVFDNPMGIQLDSLGFRYGADSPWLFRDVHLVIRPGEFVGISAPSGKGKSTLLKVLSGVLNPSEGSVLFDGRGSGEISPPDLRSAIGVVLQDEVVLSGTILENVAVFDDSPDEDWASVCLACAGLVDDLNIWPLGIHTPIGDEGISLSGGQKQRLFIARALYKRPLLLILDEATSSVDAQTEALIFSHVAAMSSTRILVSHRPEILSLCDRVFEFRDRGILERPSHSLSSRHPVVLEAQ